MIGVSVLIVTYNQKEYIADAIMGVLNQKTDFDIEIIVHDDASTDGTTEIVRQFEREYPEKIVAYYEDINMYAHAEIYAEKMLSNARGKYLAFCDGDDYWCDENKLQLQYDFMEANPDFALCAHNTRVINVKTGEESIYFSRNSQELARGEVIEKAGACFHSSSHFLRLEPWYAKHKGKDGSDMERVLWCCNEGRVMCFSNVMSVYRVQTKASWSESLNNTPSTISDFMKRVAYYERFDKETGGRWHADLELACDWLLNCTYTLLREYYRKFPFKMKILRWLEMSVDLIGLGDLINRLRKYILQRSNK